MKRFEHTRVRLERLSDGENFYGWIVRINPKEMRARLSNCEAISQHDVFQVTLASAKGRADFKAEATVRLDEIVVFAMPACVRIDPPEDGVVRQQVFGVEAELIVGGQTQKAQVADVSDMGIGLFVAVAVEPSSKARLCVSTTNGVIDCEGMVAYCRSSDSPGELTRVGLKLDPMSRLSRARWVQLLSQVA